MPLFRITHSDYIDPEAVACIHTETDFKSDDNSKGVQTCYRTTEFKSHTGMNLLVLTGTATRITDPEAKNLEYKVMRAIHNEAIAAVRERRDAKSSDELSDEIEKASQSL